MTAPAEAQSDSSCSTFRSVLPHEPLPTESYGYVHIQGALIPKVIIAKNINNNNEDAADAAGEANEADEAVRSEMIRKMSNPATIQEMLLKAFQMDESYLPHDSILLQLPSRDVLSLDLILEGAAAAAGSDAAGNAGSAGDDHVNVITKARITYPSPEIARSIVAFIRHYKISPSLLFHIHIHDTKDYNDGDDSNESNMNINYSTKNLQATQVTQIPLPPANIAWPRVGMPKFRRLLVKDNTSNTLTNENGNGNAIQKIQLERSQTRFVFMTNIIDYSTNADGAPNMDVDQSIIARLQMEPHLFQDAIRKAIAPYCCNNDDHDDNDDVLPPPEIFVLSKTNVSPFKCCHVGTRSPMHAQALIRELQGKRVTLEIGAGSVGASVSVSASASQDGHGDGDGHGKEKTLVVTGKLFLDFADITQRSASKFNQNRLGSIDPLSTSQGEIPGEASKPECTSATNSIIVPGLICLHEFISNQQEETLLACLTGPNAPWAPSQHNYSKTGSVKRRVQHYGYVFDYETSDVLRVRDCENGSCPVMPALPVGYEEWDGERLVRFMEDAGREGNGWDVLAAVVERVRRYDFGLDLEGMEMQGQGHAQGSEVKGELGSTAVDTAVDTDTGIDEDDPMTKDQIDGTTPNPNDGSSSKTTTRFQHINQMTVNEYKRGQGIGSHIDTTSAFSDGLMSISLGADCVMEFRNEQGIKKLVHLPPRSLLLMSGPARYAWSHQIVTRMTDCVDGKVIPRKTRVSLTLRTAITLPAGKDGAVEPLELVESREFPPKWGAAKLAANDESEVSGKYRENDIVFECELNAHARSLLTFLYSIDIATPETEKNHVHAVYDAIATQWHHTRGKRGVLWPGATAFLQELPKGSVVADVGCGDVSSFVTIVLIFPCFTTSGPLRLLLLVQWTHILHHQPQGKYFPAIWEAGSYVIGTDISEPLLQTSIGACAHFDSNAGPQNRQVSNVKIGLNARPAVAVADCMHIPLKSDSCDAAICIAVMHHLSTAPRRLRCLQELSRVVKVGGRINVQAWALEQDEGSRRKFAGTDVFVPFNAQPRYLDKVQAEKKDSVLSMKAAAASGENKCKGVAEMYSDAYDGAEYDERKGLVVFQRYCHMYREGELADLVSKIDTLEMVEGGFENGNHFVILKVVK